jgi:hypothetical protein
MGSRKYGVPSCTRAIRKKPRPGFGTGTAERQIGQGMSRDDAQACRDADHGTHVEGVTSDRYVKLAAETTTGTIEKSRATSAQQAIVTPDRVSALPLAKQQPSTNRRKRNS